MTVKKYELIAQAKKKPIGTSVRRSSGRRSGGRLLAMT